MIAAIVYALGLSVLAGISLRSSWLMRDSAPSWAWGMRCVAGVCSLFMAVTAFNSLPQQMPLPLIAFAVTAHLIGSLVAPMSRVRAQAA